MLKNDLLVRALQLQLQDQLQALQPEDQDHPHHPPVGAEGQGGGPDYQVEDPHGEDLTSPHPLLQDVSTLPNRESENYAHWLHPQQMDGVLLFLSTQGWPAFVTHCLAKISFRY